MTHKKMTINATRSELKNLRLHKIFAPGQRVILIKECFDDWSMIKKDADAIAEFSIPSKHLKP